MKKKLFICSLCLIGLLTACAKEPQYTDADFGTIIEDIENVCDLLEKYVLGGNTL